MNSVKEESVACALFASAKWQISVSGDPKELSNNQTGTS